jgi:hypothetical protein
MMNDDACYASCTIETTYEMSKIYIITIFYSCINIIVAISKVESRLNDEQERTLCKC